MRYKCATMAYYISNKTLWDWDTQKLSKCAPKKPKSHGRPLWKLPNLRTMLAVGIIRYLFFQHFDINKLILIWLLSIRYFYTEPIISNHICHSRNFHCPIFSITHVCLHQFNSDCILFFLPNSAFYFYTFLFSLFISWYLFIVCSTLLPAIERHPTFVEPQTANE